MLSVEERWGILGDCSGFHHTRSSRHSNQFSTKPLFLNSAPWLKISTSLGDQGSQVRVLSPRFAAHFTAVKLFSLSCSRFQLAGISHFAGTSTHSLIDVLSCKTTLSRAPSADDDPSDRRTVTSKVGVAGSSLVSHRPSIRRP